MLHETDIGEQSSIKSKRKKDELDALMRNRWYDPLNNIFFKIKKYNHAEWIVDRLNDFEQIFNGVSFFDKSESSYWSDIFNNNTKNLFPNKDRYIKICKFLKENQSKKLLKIGIYF